MTTIRQFQMNDLLKFNNVNLDVLTETYNMGFYLSYLAQWPESCLIAKSPTKIMGYVIAKAEGEQKLWHGHVSAVTVAPEYRRLGLAKHLMETFEGVCENHYHNFFVDLFVRASNTLAISMYEKFGYSCYRRVLHYYSDPFFREDALDMRKSLSRDDNNESTIPLDHPVRPEDLEW